MNVDVHKLEAGYLFPIIDNLLLQKINIFVSFIRSSIFFSLPFLVSIIIVFSITLIVRKIFILRKNWNEKSVLLEITPPAQIEKSSYSTSQLFSIIHTLGYEQNFLNKLLGRKTLFSFEIVSTRQEGIRYIIRSTIDQAENVKRMLLSYIPQVRIKEIDEYLPQGNNNQHKKTIEFKLTRHFAYPLEKQNMLEEHDPVAYITGQMTKLQPDELIAFQIVLANTNTKEVQNIQTRIIRNEHVLNYLNRIRYPSYVVPVLFLGKIVVSLIQVIGKELAWAITEFVHGSSKQQLSYNYASYQQQAQINSQIRPARVLTSFEEQAVKSIQEKIDQSLFEVAIRAMVVVNDKRELQTRTKGIVSSFAPYTVAKYQSLKLKPALLSNLSHIVFKKRLLSLVNNQSSNILSVSEIADLYHLPFGRVTQTENIVKVRSKQLPAPLSLKNGNKLDVVFGKNIYSGTTTDIGLTNEERKTHMYILGRTGSGKTTMMFAMAKHDIESGKGVAFIDPHGDVSEELLAIIPESRKKDLIYVNPIDLKYPIGINVLELTPGLDEDAAELEKEVVAEGVVSLFRKVFSKEENANAHRIEYILRNTIYTAFTFEDRTLFTISKILTNPTFRNELIKKLDDEELKDFWKYEFGKAGDYQVVKMTQGVTAKVGRFLRSPTARRILEQTKSTINFDEILDGKILLCNFSQGKLGEDTSRLLGITTLTKLQQAALKRANILEEKRKPFYLYVDEFQNFATQSFTKMLSEGRKYGLRLIIAEQSTSQQQDRSIINIIFANVTSIVCFRTGNPVDEQLLLAQFAPYIDPGEIMNLPRFNFYIKITALESEEPFSGKTIKEDIVGDQSKIDRLITASRKNNAIEYVRPQKTENKKNTGETAQISVNADTKTKTRSGIPVPKKI